MKPVIIIGIAVVFGIGVGLSINVSADEGLIPSWIKNTAGWWSENQISDSEFLDAIQFLVNNGIISVDSPQPHSCLGSAACIPGIVTKIVDGDTIKVHGKSVRFAMASAPELNDAGGIEAKKFVESICPVGSNVTIDEDDKETWGSYERMIGVIYCNDLILDEELLKAGHAIINTEYCSKSEFADTSWAKQFGC